MQPGQDEARGPPGVLADDSGERAIVECEQRGMDIADACGEGLGIKGAGHRGDIGQRISARKPGLDAVLALRAFQHRGEGESVDTAATDDVRGVDRICPERSARDGSDL